MQSGRVAIIMQLIHKEVIADTGTMQEWWPDIVAWYNHSIYHWTQEIRGQWNITVFPKHMAIELLKMNFMPYTTSIKGAKMRYPRWDTPFCDELHAQPQTQFIQDDAANKQFAQTQFIKHFKVVTNSLRLSDAYKSQQYKSSLVQVMACCLFGSKPWSEPMLP